MGSLLTVWWEIPVWKTPVIWLALMFEVVCVVYVERSVLVCWHAVRWSRVPSSDCVVCQMKQSTIFWLCCVSDDTEYHLLIVVYVERSVLLCWHAVGWSRVPSSDCLCGVCRTLSTSVLACCRMKPSTITMHSTFLCTLISRHQSDATLTSWSIDCWQRLSVSEAPSVLSDVCPYIITSQLLVIDSC